MKKAQLNLFNPFFDKELDYKNDFVSYITVGGSSSVTPKNNNIKTPLKTVHNRSFDNPYVKRTAKLGR